MSQYRTLMQDLTSEHPTHGVANVALCLANEMYQDLKKLEPVFAAISFDQGSPIEQMYFSALYTDLVLLYRFGQCDSLQLKFNSQTAFIKQDTKTNVAIELEFQKQILNMRVDFSLKIISPEQIIKLVVECDGHEFHERTKEQVDRDNTRNMDLQLMGYRVFRFSGSRIFKDPFTCVANIRKLYFPLIASHIKELNQ